MASMGNQTIDIAPFLLELRHNISNSIQEDVDQIILELKGTITENLAVVQTSVNEMNSVLRTLPSTLVRFTTDRIQPPAEGNRASFDLTVMNATLRRLKHQNEILKRRAQAATDLQEVIRQQNAILSGQNRELRLKTQQLDMRTQDLKTELSVLSSIVSLHNRSLDGSTERISDTEVTALSDRLADVTV
uniref:Uncharacterized protein n=1 Tax=Ciona savignyi TaxID=51511 RepID=H2ZBT6_CIOSA